jgi:hypothetical protein
MLSGQMTDTQQVLATVTGETDARGNPVPLTTPPTFVSSDPSIINILPDPAGDPNSALLVAVGPLASAAIVNVTAGQVSDNIAIEITNSVATGFAMKLGTPTEQTNPVPTPGGAHPTAKLISDLQAVLASHAANVAPTPAPGKVAAPAGPAKPGVRFPNKP